MKSRSLNWFALLILLTSILVVQPPTPVHASGTWTVQSSADGVANAANCPGAGCRLRDALAAAGNGDTINFSLSLPATITLTNGEMPIAHDVILTGPGSTSLSLDGNSLSRIFNIAAGRTVSISGMTLTHGEVTGWGGGILMSGISLTLNDLVFDQNTALNDLTFQDGGGIYSSGNLTITNSKFTGNTAGGVGGAIVADVGTTLSLTGVLIQNNKATSGGGVAVRSLLTPSTSISTINFNNVSMDGNKASVNNGGGLIISQATNATITNSTFSNNYASNSGGGIQADFPGTVSLTNVTLSNNIAIGAGAGLFSNGLGGGTGPIDMNNVTIASNAATVDGGGIFSLLTEIRLKNSIIAGNTTSGSNPDCYASITSQDYNLIGAVSVSCLITGTTTHNITSTDPLLAALADNGGPTQTRALQTGSPAIDAANNATCASTDQRGVTRPKGVSCDIGAYEYAAHITVNIGGAHQGSYDVATQGNMRVNYAGVDNGPVQVASTYAIPIIAAERDAWASNGTTTSFAQLMGLPASQLSDTYVFPAYNNVTLNEQLRIGNVDSVPTTVTVTIGGVLQGTYPLAASEAVRVNYAGLDSGPVIVQGTTGVHIIAAERDAWAANGTTTSFVQLMGLPAGQLSDTYVFPAYNNVTLNEQLRIGNVDSIPTTVTVTIGGVLQGTYPLAANTSVRVNYAGLDSGPVIVQGTPGVHIIAAERDAWAAMAPYNTTTSFAQLMGLPAGQLSDTYEFPAYNNVTLNEQLRIGNVDSVPSTVTVTIGGVLRGTYPLAANGSVRVNYAGLDSGPVVVHGTSGVHIIAAERDAWSANGVTTSFTQLMGLPAGSLSDTFLFPAYNNVTLNEQLRFAVP